ncbi:MAG: peroxiredoxin-like family protein [Candidatus Auribacterota bacterium]
MKIVIVSTSLILSFFLGIGICTAQDTSAPVVSFSDQIEHQKTQSEKSIPKDIREIMDEATQELMFSSLTQKSLQIYDTVPDFELQSITGKTVSTELLRQSGYLVIVFYRGGWCPYCNIHLQALNTAYPRIKDLNASMIAISPQISVNPTEHGALQYEVLIDRDNKIAKKFGIVFQLNDDVIKIYKDLGIYLKEYNGNNDNELPVPATYIVAPDGVIEYAYINPDYRERPDPEKIIEFLESVKDALN